MAFDRARSVGRTRDVRARVDASEPHARLVLRATGVPEAHGRGGRAVVRAHAHGPVLEHQALFVGRTRAVAFTRAPALAVPVAPAVWAAITVGQALAGRGRARQLARVADREPVPARAPGAVIAHSARLGRFAGQPVARVTARAVGAARPGRRAVGVRGARRRDGGGGGGGGAVVAGPLHAGPGVRRTAQLRVARVTVRARAPGPVQRRPAERVKAARTPHATRVDATSADARLFVCTLTVVGALDRCTRDAS